MLPSYVSAPAAAPQQQSSSYSPNTAPSFAVAAADPSYFDDGVSDPEPESGGVADPEYTDIDYDDGSGQAAAGFGGGNAVFAAGGGGSRATSGFPKSVGGFGNRFNTNGGGRSSAFRGSQTDFGAVGNVLPEDAVAADPEFIPLD
jgi:hypothetical protein